MKEESKIILHWGNMGNHPECPHGPTLLFSRGVGARRFYACSAYRDRKYCDFFLWEDDKITAGKKLAWSISREKLLPKLNYMKLQEIKANIVKEAPKNRAYCNTCSCLFIIKDCQTVHENHDIVFSVSDYLLSHPSKLMRLKEGAKKESQFIFSASTIDCFISGLTSLKVEKLICIGTPSLKETCPLPSLLLDIDHRYASFYNSSEFLWFNLCNHHFFAENGLASLKRSFSNANCAIILDPPFGVLMEPIQKTLTEIITQCNLSDPPIFLVLPYFMEKQVVHHFPGFVMLDYEVNYTNHDKFNANGRKQGSPVRIFTNFKQFNLPKSEGYHLCSKCDRWVSDKNKHCSKCNECTSKNGDTYKHCNICQKCVKPTWEHCSTCQKCTLVQHKCSSDENPLKRKRTWEGENKRKRTRHSKVKLQSN